MATELLKSIDELDDAEREALVDRVFTTEFMGELDAAMEAAKRMRASVAQHPGRECWSREELVAAMNGAEYTRLMMHVALSMAGANIDRVLKRIASAGCAYCEEWKYADQDFGIPLDRELTDEEIVAVDERVKDAIREHVKTCPNHPMRALERERFTADEVCDVYAVACWDGGNVNRPRPGQEARAADVRNRAHRASIAQRRPV